ncbi:unnamed protein product [Toxocara canis]|uniref:Uncharacterized protein n=1 Tax=Toxocara canis TaxID=6265 RepID=A0A183U781_TOXCA|nr:unnamed protein product [Toxocara canis]
MLEGKCRLWMEVRMLPKCVRLQPFSVQQSLELDCEKLPTLDICRHGQLVASNVILSADFSNNVFLILFWPSMPKADGAT